MPDRSGDTNQVNNEDRYHVKLAGDDIKRLSGIVRDGNIIQAGNQTKPEVENVKSNKTMLILAKISAGFPPSQK